MQLFGFYLQEEGQASRLQVLAPRTAHHSLQPLWGRHLPGIVRFNFVVFFPIGRFIFLCG